MHAAGLVHSAEDAVPTDLPDGVHPEDPIPIEEKYSEAITSFDRDRPRPFRISEFRAHIENRQTLKPQRNSKGGWDRLAPGDIQKNYSPILNKLRVLTSDPRIHFLMKEYEKDSADLASVMQQFLNIRDEGQANLKIVDISGLPNEVAGPLAGAVARLLFQYKLYQTREEREKDPVLLVCEEAHRYVPNRGDAQYEVAQTAVRRIAREGRKYGLGLMLVSQRPSDIEGTVISQCNSWIVLRLGNSGDQEHVARFLPDSLAGMTKALSSLPRQEALFVGEAAAIPARIKLRTLKKGQLPDSDDISFAGGWSSDGTTGDQLDAITSRMIGASTEKDGSDNA
jgi:hypothetical protein